jgi:hypothetical protein
MFVLVLAVFFAWSRETRSDGGLGWLESARRANMATLVGSHRDASGAAPPRTAPPARGTESVDDDDEHLAAYNAFLARINKPREP